MDANKLKAEHKWVRDQLDNVTEFWMKNGWDREHGGVSTYLDRFGRIYSTDKSVWMQGRCGWTYAYLCSNYGIREDWLDFSKGAGPSSSVGCADGFV